MGCGDSYKAARDAAWADLRELSKKLADADARAARASEALRVIELELEDLLDPEKNSPASNLKLLDFAEFVSTTIDSVHASEGGTEYVQKEVIEPPFVATNEGQDSREPNPEEHRSGTERVGEPLQHLRSVARGDGMQLVARSLVPSYLTRRRRR